MSEISCLVTEHNFCDVNKHDCLTLIYISFLFLGLSRRLCKELDQHLHLCKEINVKAPGPVGDLEDILKYISQGYLKNAREDCTTQRALLVRGKVGSGKSTLAARLASDVFSVDGWTQACCVVRFVRGSIECETEEQLLSSLCEQLCTLTKLHPTQAYQVSQKPIYWSSQKI